MVGGFFNCFRSQCRRCSQSSLLIAYREVSAVEVQPTPTVPPPHSKPAVASGFNGQYSILGGSKETNQIITVRAYLQTLVRHAGRCHRATNWTRNHNGSFPFTLAGNAAGIPLGKEELRFPASSSPPSSLQRLYCNLGLVSVRSRHYTAHTTRTRNEYA